MKKWPTGCVAAPAALIVHPGIVFCRCTRVHSYGNGDLLAGPTIGGAGIVVAYESTHDVGVIFLNATPSLVGIIEVEDIVFFFEET